MARPDRSRYDDEPRRPQGGLSLSTGRFAGRSAASARSVSRSTSRSSSTRHNPLRDEYPSSRDRRREPAPDRRHSGTGRSSRAEDRRNDFDDRGGRRPRSSGNQGRSGAGRSGRANHAVDAFSPKMHTLAPQGMALGQFNIARMAMGVIVVFLVVVFAMALFHIGPFAAASAKDGSKHVGVAGANAIGGNASNIAQNIASQVSLAQPVEPELAKLPAHAPTRDDLTNLAGQKAPFAFALDNTADENGEQPSAPVLSDRSLVSLNNALSYYDNNGYEASYLLLDLGTGRGIAGNLDSPIYGASSFKGPYCAYVVNKEFPNDINNARSSRLTQVENTIVWSDNSSYGKLRRTYGTEGMEAWLAEAGVDTSLVNDTYFPTYTARQSALMWLKIYEYLTTADTSAAQWLSDTFAKTEVSFLRNGALGTTSAGHTDYLPEEGSGGEEGVEEEQGDEGTESEEAAEGGSEGETESATAAEGETETAAADAEADKTVASIGTNITVRNKAGWIDGQEDDAVCDSGIVTINGRDYLMVIMTSAPDCAEGEQAFARLAHTLFEIRGDLV
ncbi:serine hydrolase [Adlercreutzia shanghongiae]|uniref:Serine hydrolase n=1 Tax=Adlercreutzia shanghongiae TaxID=3111773 RepID=A0ABU6J184_9ACTN|nr:hypothetical protein [Adlercreutzia sp. R22]MEC4295902.1 hypothetical protein [Adlercreutzia sp. R22]